MEWTNGAWQSHKEMRKTIKPEHRPCLRFQPCHPLHPLSVHASSAFLRMVYPLKSNIFVFKNQIPIQSKLTTRYGYYVPEKFDIRLSMKLKNGIPPPKNLSTALLDTRVLTCSSRLFFDLVSEAFISTNEKPAV